MNQEYKMKSLKDKLYGEKPEVVKTEKPKVEAKKETKKKK